MDPALILEACAALAGIGRGQVWVELGPHMTCGEVDGFTAVLVATGHRVEADALMDSHLASDRAVGIVHQPRRRTGVDDHRGTE